MAKTLPWFRMYSEAVDDPKLRLLAFEDRWHFVAILCCKCQGILDRDDPEIARRMLAVKLGLDLRELDEAVRRLSEVGLIDRETMQPPAWGERQFKSDSSAERVREYRERQKKQQDKKPKRNSNVTVTAQETETDTETDTDKTHCALSRTPSRFDEFWQAYPVKRDKKKARDKWKAKRLDNKADLIISDVHDRQARDGQWIEGYIPLPTTYLNGERWEDEISQRRRTNQPTGDEARNSAVAQAKEYRRQRNG